MEIIFELSDLALEMVERREAAGRTQPLCPSCESEQVQLVDWRKWPVVFKCRKCKRRFEMMKE